jgi:cysteinyl-tRNA synthetase
MFTGNSPLLEKAYSPMTVRFYMLQAHYSSPVDFSNDSLLAAEQGLSRLMKGLEVVSKLTPSAESTIDVETLVENGYAAMGDDLNCPILLGTLFEGVRIANSIRDGKAGINSKDLTTLRDFMHTFTIDLLGLIPEEKGNSAGDVLLGKVIDLLLQQRQDAKIRKDYAASDAIRKQMEELGIVIRDTKAGAEWEIR